MTDHQLDYVVYFLKSIDRTLKRLLFSKLSLALCSGYSEKEYLRELLKKVYKEIEGEKE